MLPLILEDVSYVANGRTIIDRVSCAFTAGPRTVLIPGPTDFGPRMLPTRDHARLLAARRPDPEQGVREIILVSGLIDALREGRSPQRSR